MKLDFAEKENYCRSPFHDDAPAQKVGGLPLASDCQWTIIIPFLNEERFLTGCLASVASQSVGFELILVDNGSTDGSWELAQHECRRLGIPYQLLEAPRRGKVHALECGLAQVRTPLVATFDADTTYPPHYLATASILLEQSGCVGAQAYYVEPKWRDWRRLAAALKFLAVVRLLPHQCHTGGAGQVFCLEALRRSGGFDPRRWDLILEDHEVMHRLSQLGKFDAHFSFWCCPSRRETDIAALRWSFVERLGYHLTPPRHQSRFFYRFLAPRLQARRQLTVTSRKGAPKP